MTRVWCVRADGGRYTKVCIIGGFTGIGWDQIGDLSPASSRDDLYPIYRSAYPHDTSNIVIGQQVGQLARFLFDIKAGDTVITPDGDGEQLWYGVVDPDPSYFHQPNDPSCRYGHRRRVTWSKQPMMRSGLSVPLQNTLQSSLTVFGVSQVDEVLHLTGRGGPITHKSVYDPYSAVLERILTLDDKEFEILVAHLLTALGFDGSEVVGKVGDGGVDAMGELNIAGLAKIKIYVQAKRYKVGTKITASTVRQLRQAIPFGGQGAFITTASFQSAALDVALEAGFPRIGLVNGNQLVDLLVEHWTDIPAEFQERLGLKPGLVLA